MLLRATFLIICMISGLIAYKATEPTTLLISRVIFFGSLIAFLAHISHPEIFG